MHELLKLAYQLDQKAFVKSFADQGFEVKSYDSIETLAHLHQKGEDERGVTKDKFGNKIIFSVEKTLHNMRSNFTENFNRKKLNLKWK